MPDDPGGDRLLTPGSPAPAPAGWRRHVQQVRMELAERSSTIDTQHYAFLVTDREWDEIFGRLTERGVTYYADPGCSRPGEVNDHDGGRGTYFHEPGGHLLEIITVPYGGWRTR